MQTKLDKVIEGVGLIIFIIGISAGDSDNLLYPFALICIGSMLFYIVNRSNPEAFGIGEEDEEDSIDD